MYKREKTRSYTKWFTIQNNNFTAYQYLNTLHKLRLNIVASATAFLMHKKYLSYIIYNSETLATLEPKLYVAFLHSTLLLQLVYFLLCNIYNMKAIQIPLPNTGLSVL